MTGLLRLAALVVIVLALRWLWLWFWRRGWKRIVASAVRHVESKSSLPPRHGTVKRDPICGTHVDVNVSVREVVDGETHYFCSERCRQAYRARSRPAKQKVGVR